MMAHGFGELIAAIVNWRTVPAVIQREPGVCFCGQTITTHDHSIHEARWAELHAEKNSVEETSDE